MLRKLIRQIGMSGVGLVLATASVLLPSQTWGGAGSQLDPFGLSPPSAEKARQQLERVFGQPIPAGLPVRGTSGLRPGQPYSGPSVPTRHTVAEAGVTVEATADDLAETPEVRFTPEVLKVVQRFAGDPEQLYLYVKNNFEFTPYLGSQKGSQGTLLEFSGNDFDQASLLIALLRGAGIPARYVFGAMTIKLDKALNWLGVEKADVALQVLQWQGIAAQIVKTTLVLNRVWVEAFLTPKDGTKPRWVPMDPAFKQYTVLPGSRLARQVPFDQNEYLGLPVQDGRTAYEFFRDRVQEQLDATQPGTTTEDISRARVISPAKDLPFKLETDVRVSGELSALTDAQRFRITLYTVDAAGVSAQVTLSLPEVYGRRLTVSFPPATPQDETLVQQYGGYYQVPADLLHVRPAIKLDGQVLVQGSRVVGIGQGHFLVVDFLAPGYGLIDRVFHTLFAGGYYAVGLDTIGDAGSILLDRRGEEYVRALGKAADPSYSDDERGEMLSLAALEYLDNLERQTAKLAALLHNVQAKDVAEALTGQIITVELVDGVFRFRPIGWFIDVKRIPARPFAVDGDESDLGKKIRIKGLTSSYLENHLWEEYAGLPSISTALGLQFANEQAIPILTIDQSNASMLLPTLNVFPEVRREVEDAVSQGHVVTIPRDTLFFHDWAGSAWIDDLPGGLATAYRVLGGILGGSTALDPKKKVGQNPLCSAVSQAMGTDETRATGWQESAWRQFREGRPLNRKGDTGTMQVNRGIWATGKPTVDIDGDTRKDVVDLERLEYEYQYNIAVGSAILSREYQPRAQAHMNSLVGAGNYTAAQLFTETYFLYNHGGHAETKAGQRVEVFYYAKDANGNLVPASYPNLTEAAQETVETKQGNADSSREYFEALQNNPGQDPITVLEGVEQARETRDPDYKPRIRGCSR